MHSFNSPAPPRDTRQEGRRKDNLQLISLCLICICERAFISEWLTLVRLHSLLVRNKNSFSDVIYIPDCIHHPPSIKAQSCSELCRLKGFWVFWEALLGQQNVWYTLLPWCVNGGTREGLNKYCALIELHCSNTGMKQNVVIYWVRPLGHRTESTANMRMLGVEFEAFSMQRRCSTHWDMALLFSPTWEKFIFTWKKGLY